MCWSVKTCYPPGRLGKCRRVASSQELASFGTLQGDTFGEDMAYNELAWLYAEENIKLDEALQLVDRALSEEPENTVYLDTKAEVLLKMGYYEESKNLRDIILKHQPPDKMRARQLEKLKELTGLKR